MSAKAVISTSERAAAPAALGLEAATIAVLAGGRSTEREVSLSSAREIARALATPSGPEDRRGPARVVEVELAADGRWIVAGRSLAVGEALAALAGVDVVFSGLHGGEGEGGTIQGLCAAAGLATTGSDVRGSAVALDKVFSRELVRAAGGTVARGRAVDLADWRRDPDRELAVLVSWPGAGWVVKPRCGGSSVGTAIARRADELPGALETAFRYEDEALVEELLVGVELTGGVVEDPAGSLVALPAIEIRPHPGRFFDYEEKYSPAGAAELCPPESVSAEIGERVRRLSLLAHRTLRCRGYSRSDFLLPAGSREPVFLEANTLPGMTPRSLVPLAARTAGIDYRTLCLWIAAAALRGRGR
ncbi:MAG: D-alanine--D-alanine ligase [Planctomycetota bacterium]